jgi:hypothetical protein
MDKLEHYLDQVCRSIGGPRSLRQHVRQELREHLRDAAAEHRATGLSAEQALDRALEDFGGPEQVRSELEATHGHRLMPVVIDKAIEWKEMTMKAKWLWMTWAHLAVMSVIALEVLWISFATIFLVPKFQKLMADGMIDSRELHDQAVSWMPAFLNGVQTVGGRYTTWLVLLSAVAWGVFEWRVRSENKSFMRLSALGTVAAALMVVGMLMAGSLVIPFELAMPAMGRLARPFALQQIATIERSMNTLEQAIASKDWEAMQGQATGASQAVSRLGASAFGLLSRPGQPTANELWARLDRANESLLQAQQAIREKDAERLRAALQKFHRLYDPVTKEVAQPDK